MELKKQNVVAVSCPPCGENVALATKRGAYKAISLMSPSIGPADHFLRKGGRLAFTLIELLIAVLIIGILTAVAVPMYQRAVYKSRFSKLMLPAKTLASANEAYFLANGEYSEVPARLDVGSDSATFPDGSSILLSTDDTVSFVRLSNAEVPNARYVVYQQRSASFAGATMCESLDTDERATWLCSKGLNGTKVEEGNSGAEAGWSAYILTGTVGQNDQFAAIGSNTGNDEPGDDVDDEPQEPQTPTKPTCGGVEQPDDIAPTESKPATGTATCVNGQWKYTWMYDTDYDSWTTVCTGSSAYACAGSEFKGDRNLCDATQENGCADSTFSGYWSICEGKAANGCAGSTFSGQGAYCGGRAANGCAGTTFSGYNSNCRGYVANGCAGTTLSGEMSYCWGQAANGCAGANIQAGAHCNAYTSGGCDGAKYGADPTGQRKGIGSCRDDDKGYCPTGVPVFTDASSDWNVTNGSYDYTWKGGYCDPNAMISGNCPAGSPKQGGGCWDGSGNQVVCE